MQKYELQDMVRGWFVGDFEPSLYKTTDVEVAVQNFKKGAYETSHCHKVATEITVIITGKAKMAGKELCAGQILKILPGEYSDFEALEDTTTVVVKLPGALNDKYLKNND